MVHLVDVHGSSWEVVVHDVVEVVVHVATVVEVAVHSGGGSGSSCTRVVVEVDVLATVEEVVVHGRRCSVSPVVVHSRCWT